MLLISVIFSGYYQHWRSNVSGIKQSTDFYMSESNFRGGLWINENINKDKKMVGYDELTSRRIFSISEVPTLVGDSPTAMLSYGFISGKKMNVSPISPLSTSFYLDSPYKLNDYIIDETYSDYTTLKSNKIDTKPVNSIIDKYNLFYVIEKVGYNAPFLNLLREERENIYNDGNIRIWRLDS